MIYSRPEAAAPIDQGDIVEDCPLSMIESFDLSHVSPPTHLTAYARAIVLTQTCDLAQGKVSRIVVAPVVDAQVLIDRGQLKSADVRGPVRAGRVHGWYFLPRSSSLGLPESIVDLRTLHTVPLEMLEELCRAGKRIAHLESLYREHLAQHFANTYSRIGLPMPYETE
jgi:hypothetical protein